MTSKWWRPSALRSGIAQVSARVSACQRKLGRSSAPTWIVLRIWGSGAPRAGLSASASAASSWRSAFRLCGRRGRRSATGADRNTAGDAVSAGGGGVRHRHPGNEVAPGTVPRQMDRSRDPGGRGIDGAGDMCRDPGNAEIGSQRISDDRDGLTPGARAFGEVRPIRLAEAAPIATVDEDGETARFFLRMKQVESGPRVIGVGKIEIGRGGGAVYGGVGRPAAGKDGRIRDMIGIGIGRVEGSGAHVLPALHGRVRRQGSACPPDAQKARPAARPNRPVCVVGVSAASRRPSRSSGRSSRRHPDPTSAWPWLRQRRRRRPSRRYRGLP